MEITITRHRTLILLLLCITAFSLSAQDADSGLSVGLMPIFCERTSGIDYSESLYQLVFDRVLSAAQSDTAAVFYPELPGIADHYASDKQIFPKDDLFSFQERPIREYSMKEHDLGKIIYGTIRYIDTIAVFSLFTATPGSKDVESFFSSVITSQTLHDVGVEAFTALFEEISGEEAGSIDSSLITDDQKLLIDRTPVTPEEDILLVMPYGSYDLEILQHNETIDRRELIVAEEQVLITGTQALGRKVPHLLSVTPDRSEVYIDSIYRGVSPLIFYTYPLESTLLTIKSEGFMVESIPVTIGSPFEIEEDLRYEFQSRTSEISFAKESWYRSLSSVILTLPISIISKFLYDNTGDEMYRTIQLFGIMTTGSCSLLNILNLFDYYHRID